MNNLTQRQMWPDKEEEINNKFVKQIQNMILFKYETFLIS